MVGYALALSPEETCTEGKSTEGGGVKPVVVLFGRLFGSFHLGIINTVLLRTHYISSFLLDTTVQFDPADVSYS